MCCYHHRTTTQMNNIEEGECFSQSVGDKPWNSADVHLGIVEFWWLRSKPNRSEVNSKDSIARSSLINLSFDGLRLQFVFCCNLTVFSLCCISIYLFCQRSEFEKFLFQKLLLYSGKFCDKVKTILPLFVFLLVG